MYNIENQNENNLLGQDKIKNININDIVEVNDENEKTISN